MPQFQVLEGVPNFAQQLASSLGGGISEGISKQLEKFNQAKQSERQLKGLAPLLKDIIPQDSLAALSKSGLEPKTIVDISKLLQEQKHLDEYKKSLGALDGSSSFEENIPNQEIFEGPTSQSSSTKAPVKPIQPQIKPVLASSQLPPPTSARDIPAHSTARLQAKQLGYTQNKKLIESIDTDAKKAKELRPLIKRAAQITKKGGVGGISGTVQEKLGETIPFFKNPDVAEFQRIQKEMTVGNFRTDFGARPSQSEFFYITDVYGRPGDTKEAIMRKLSLEDWKAQIKEKREEAKNEIFRKYGEYPLNLNELVEDKLKPTYDKFLEKTGYNKWEADQKKAKPLNDEIMRKYLRENGNDPDKALEALQKDNYQVIQ